MTDEKGKPTIDEMWQFIEGLMRPNELVPDKSVLNYDDVFAIYSKLMDLDQLFREIIQIRLVEKEMEREEQIIV